MMDAGLVSEIREKVQPAVEQLIALAAERGLSRLEICQDGLEIKVERPNTGVPSYVIDEMPSLETAPAVFEDEHHHLTPVLSSLVGIFKLRSAPERPPAAAVGAAIEAGQVLGFIESMGLSYEIHAPSAGRLAEILVDDSHPVEYGQPLMVLEAE